MAITIDEASEGAVFHVRATGKLTHEDYEHWVPALDARIEECGPVSILFEMHDFHGWTAGALWDDIKFGVRHFGKIERIAMVGEKRWQKGMATFCRPFTKARVRYFEADELDAAREWVRQGQGAIEA